MQRTTCALTGKSGNFVKAHIIPKALTRRPTNAPFIQVGQADRPIRRWDSWYDPNLVTQSGEDILTAIDTEGIKELRRLKLVWSSWGPMQSLTMLDHHIIDSATITQTGLRVINSVNSKTLRLFFLSLLWRAANSDLDDFKFVSLKHSDNRKLRRMILNNVVQPYNRFAMSMVQISSLAPAHNQAPFLEQVELPNARGKYFKREVIRFFLDGLVVHISAQSIPQKDFLGHGQLMLCADRQTLGVPTKPWGLSRQYEMINTVKDETEKLYPGLASKMSS